MPFSFSHPLAVLPIKHKWKKQFDLTGLVLGSIAPDFEYFIKFRPEALIGHGLTGFLLLNLPLCVVFAYLFHWVIKKPLIACLPKPFDKGYAYFAEKDWKIRGFNDMLIFAYSSLIGMFTHVFWDSFTHKNGRFVVWLPVLSREVEFMGDSIPIYKFLQHGSTLIGSLAILIFIFRLRRTESKTNSIPTWCKLIYYFTILFVGIAFVVSGFCFSLIKLTYEYRGVIVVTFINGLFTGCLFISCVLNRINCKRGQI